jgi:hypothetical protein
MRCMCLVCLYRRRQVAKAVVGTAGCPDCLNHWAGRVSPSALLLVEIRGYTVIVSLVRRQVAQAVVGTEGFPDCLNHWADMFRPSALLLVEIKGYSIWLSV